jgi:hypothetical protein
MPAKSAYKGYKRASEEIQGTQLFVPILPTKELRPLVCPTSGLGQECDHYRKIIKTKRFDRFDPFDSSRDPSSFQLGFVSLGPLPCIARAIQLQPGRVSCRDRPKNSGREQPTGACGQS